MLKAKQTNKQKTTKNHTLKCSVSDLGQKEASISQTETRKDEQHCIQELWTRLNIVTGPKTCEMSKRYFTPVFHEDH